MKLKFLLSVSLICFLSIVYSCSDSEECCTQARSWFMGDNTIHPGVMLDTFVFQTKSDQIDLSFRFNSLCVSDQLLFELYAEENLVESLEVFDFGSTYSLDTEEEVVYTLYTSVIPRPDPPAVCIRLGEVEVSIFY